MAKFLEYVPGTSFLHRMNPSVKLVCAILFAIACFTTSNLIFLGVLLAGAVALAAGCGLGRETAGLMKAVFAFSLILAVVLLLTTPTGAPLVALPWGYLGTGSLLAALTAIVRLEAAAIPLFLVFYVTRMSDITNSAVKQLHVPYKYAFTFTSTVHFIPVFMNDMAGIMEAQTARGVAFDGSLAKEDAAYDASVRAPARQLRAQDELRRHRRRGARLQPAHPPKRLQGLPPAYRGLPGPGRLRPHPGRRHRPDCPGIAFWPSRSAPPPPMQAGGVVLVRIKRGVSL